MRAKSSVIKNDRKYSLIKPFWFDTIVDASIWNCATVLGRIFSIHVRSNDIEADFWLNSRFILGNDRWIKIGKYPS